MALKFLKKEDLFGKVPPLSRMLHTHLRVHDPARSLSNIHASELTREKPVYCPRRAALMTKLLMKQDGNTLSTSESVTYQIGRDLQDSVAHWFADMGVAYGDWKCLGCGHLSEFCTRPETCPKCKASTFKPVEMRFKSKVCGASCGVDLAVKLPGKTKLTPIEIKTIDKDEFKKLIMPYSEHNLRTTLYLRLIHEADTKISSFMDTTEARVLYVSKGGYGCAQDWLKGSLLGDQFSPFKEYAVPRNDALVENLVKSAAKAFLFFEKGVMPDGVCSSSLSERAKSCECRQPCWSGKYPPDHLDGGTE